MVMKKDIKVLLIGNIALVIIGGITAAIALIKF